MILDDLTVVELGSGSIAGSFAGMMLADAGARVVKVEPPGGDRLREGLPSGFLAWNRGKDSVVVDLRSESGVVEARSLVSRADVVIEGFGVGTAERFGLTYEQLGAPERLVYCSIKGFGSTGAHAGLKAYDGVVAAKAGVFTRKTATFRAGPVFVNAWFPSIGAGHLAHAGILAALIVRDRSGRGQRVDATMLQGLHPYDYFGTMQWQYVQSGRATNVAGTVKAERYGLIPCTGDGRWVVFSTMLTHQCHALLRALELESILEDPRFADAPRFANADDAEAYEDLVRITFRQRSFDEWRPRLLAEHDIAFEAIIPSEEALEHEQVRANGDAITVADDLLGPVVQAGPVAHFERTPLQVRSSAPALAQKDGSRETVAAGASTPPSAGPRDAVPAHPLSGITIVEFGYFYAMPFGITLAASLGARVIKIEDGRGDPMRWTWGTKETSSAKTMEGKESLAVDLRTDEGRHIVRQLVERADVFVDGFRPGVAARLGVDRESLVAIKPDLLYVQAAGYGTSGPYSHRPLYAFTVSAAAGSYWRQSAPWVEPERAAAAGLDGLDELRDHIVTTGEGDAYSALGLFSALMLGLRERGRSGEGQLISTSMLGSNTHALADDFIRYAGKPPGPRNDPGMYGLHALYRLYPTASGWVFLAAPKDDEWRRLVEAIDRPDLADDRRFATVADRRSHDDELVVELELALATRPAQEWESALSAAGVGCAQVFEGTVSEFTNTDLVLRETGMVAEVDHPHFGRILRHGLPVHLHATPGRLAPGCTVGQHTDAILAELGYSDDQIDDLVGRDVVSRGDVVDLAQRS